MLLLLSLGSCRRAPHLPVPHAGVPYVINVTLPDEKENYVHRIGRVGRADRMGLALSLVATVQEKVCRPARACAACCCPTRSPSRHPSAGHSLSIIFFNLQVWYHSCPGRGKGCHNTRLKEQGGCTIWYDEPQVRLGCPLAAASAFLRGLALFSFWSTPAWRPTPTHLPLQLLSDIQEHLGVVIPEIDASMEVPVDEFDGKVRWMHRLC